MHPQEQKKILYNQIKMEMIFPDFHGNILGERKITEKDLKKKSNNIFPSEILECEKKEFKFHQIKVSEA